MASCDVPPPVIIVKAAGVTSVRVCLEEREGVEARHESGRRKRRGREKVTPPTGYELLESMVTSPQISAVKAKAKHAF